MSDDCCNIDITLTTNPVEVTVEGQVIDATISNNTIDVEACNTNLSINLVEEPIKIEFPDPAQVGPQGPAGGSNLVFLSEDRAEDICNIFTGNGPSLVFQEVIVDGCRKFKILVVEDVP